MKKGIVAVLVLFTVLITAGSLIGCSKTKADETKATGKTYSINIATATTGGAYYPIGNAMAQICRKTFREYGLPRSLLPVRRRTLI